MKKKFLVLCLILLASTFVLSAQNYGDADKNGNVDIMDALLVARYYVGMVKSIDVNLADVNGDKEVTITDALSIARYYVGLIDSFPVEKKNDKEIEVRSSLKKEMNPQVNPGEIDKVVKGINQFAYEFYETIKDTEDNVLFSPISISYAFAMCSVGAKGNTKAEIGDTLHFPYKDGTLHKVYNSLESKVTTLAAETNPDLKNDLILNMANSAWGQKGTHFLPTFLDILALNYGSGMNLLDFSRYPEPSRLIINDWVAEKTEDMITELLPKDSIKSYTVLVLINTIYFNGTWMNQFLLENTRDDLFFNLDGSKNTVPMMHGKESAAYYDGGNYQMMIKNYRGTKRNAMYIILPAEGQFDAVEASLSSGLLDKAKSGTKRYKVDLTLPKFEYSWNDSLPNYLKSLGMIDPFSSNKADFSGINGGKDLFITNVIHEAAIAVDELGTEASAATAILIGRTSIQNSATMNINRPFLYVIRNEDTGAILFMGKVTKL